MHIIVSLYALTCLLSTGTGKTTLAAAAAFEAGAHFVTLSPADCLSKYQGESERALRKVFADAKQRTQSPTIIFFDEADALAPARGGASDDLQARRFLSELLVQISALDQHLDRGSGTSSATSSRVQRTAFVGPERRSAGASACFVNQQRKKKCPARSSEQEDEKSDPEFKEEVMVSDFEEDGSDEAEAFCSSQPVLVIAATNLVADLDPAFVRRFSSRIFVTPPPVQDRAAIVSHLVRSLPHTLSDSDILDISERTEGWSGADLKLLCRHAAMRPLRSLLQELKQRSYPKPSAATTCSTPAANDMGGNLNATAEYYHSTKKRKHQGCGALSTEKEALRNESAIAVPVVVVADFEAAYEALAPTVELTSAVAAAAAAAQSTRVHSPPLDPLPAVYSTGSWGAPPPWPPAHPWSQRMAAEFPHPTEHGFPWWLPLAPWWHAQHPADTTGFGPGTSTAENVPANSGVPQSMTPSLHRDTEATSAAAADEKHTTPATPEAKAKAAVNSEHNQAGAITTSTSGAPAMPVQAQTGGQWRPPRSTKSGY